MTLSLTLLQIRSCHFDVFFRILCGIKMKFGQISVQLMNIPNMILALKRLETSSKPFNDFDKMEVQCNLLIFRRYYFLGHPKAYLQKSKKKKHKLIIIAFIFITVGW